MSDFKKVVVIVPASVKIVKSLRNLLRNFLNANDVKNEDIVYDMELVIAEALVNVVEHTYDFDSSKQIACAFEINDDFLEIKIRDFGAKVDIKKLKPRSLSKPREGGLGLYLIRNLVDEWEYEKVEVGNSLVLRRKVK